MPNTLRLKRSAVASKVPLTTDLQLGELAINTFDGKLYLKKDNGVASIVDVGATTANIRVFTASGNYTPSAGTTSIMVYLTGGGGAGGSTQSTTSLGNLYLAGSGAAGNTIIFTMPATSASTYTITIGAGATTTPSGTTSAGVPGAAGSASTFALGATIIATAAGGPGGSAAAVGTAPTNGQAASVTAPNATYVASTGYLALRGGSGNVAFGVVTSSTGAGNVMSGQGGASFWGPGGAMFGAGTAAGTPYINGGAALVYGAGGGGGAKIGRNTTASNVTGGAGFNGVCMIVEMKS